MAAGAALGIMPDQGYAETTVDLDPQDAIVLVTDGITDPLGTASSPLGQAGLLGELVARTSVRRVDLRGAALRRPDRARRHRRRPEAAAAPPPRDARPRAQALVAPRRTLATSGSAAARGAGSCRGRVVSATSSAARSYSAECVTRASTKVPGAGVRRVGRAATGRPARRSRAPGLRGGPSSRYSRLVGRALDQHAQHAAAHARAASSSRPARWMRSSSRRRASTSFCGTRFGSSAATVPSSREKLKTPT